MKVFRSAVLLIVLAEESLSAAARIKGQKEGRNDDGTSVHQTQKIRRQRVHLGAPDDEAEANSKSSSKGSGKTSTGRGTKGSSKGSKEAKCIPLSPTPSPTKGSKSKQSGASSKGKSNANADDSNRLTLEMRGSGQEDPPTKSSKGSKVSSAPVSQQHPCTDRICFSFIAVWYSIESFSHVFFPLKIHIYRASFARKRLLRCRHWLPRFRRRLLRV